MTDPEIEHNANVQRSLEAQAEAQIADVESLAVLIGGENAQPADVFPWPKEIRRDAPEPDWTAEQTDAVWETARKYDFGSHEDIKSPLVGGKRVFQAGLAWKVAGEAEVAKNEPGVTEYNFAGSPHVVLRNDELDFVEVNYGVRLPEGSTQYDAAEFFASRFSTEVLDEPEVLPFGYELAPGNPIVHEATGQYRKIGTRNGQDVTLFRTDREFFGEPNDQGNRSYRHQPDVVEILSFISNVMRAEGDHDSPIVFVTSATYASNVPGAQAAGLDNNRPMGVTMYGRNTILALDAPVPAEMGTNQLQGEFRVLHANAERLLDAAQRRAA